MGTYIVRVYHASWSGNWDEAPLAETTFTDSNENYQHWKDEAPGEWTNGALHSGNSDYFEGDVVPHYWKSEKLTVGTTYAFNIYYDYYDPSGGGYCGFDYLAQYNTSRTTTFVDATPSQDNALPEGHGYFYTAGADITNVSSPVTTGNQRYVQVTFTATATKAEFYWGLHAALPGAILGCQGARSWSGASLQTNVGATPSVPGATMLGGGGTLQLNPGGLVQGSISGFKWNDQDGQGDVDGTEPKLGGWTIKLCSDSNCTTVLQTTQTDSSGNYTFSVTPGTYYVREEVQTGWTQTFPASGYHGPLIVSASTPTHTGKNFGNKLQQFALTVTKDGNGSGTVTSSPTGINCGTDCTEDYNYGTEVTLTATAGTGSTFTGWSGDCSGTNPTTTVTMTKARSCTATFTLAQGTLIVKKVVTNNDGGTKSCSDFSFKVGNGNPIPFEPDCENELTVDAGTYTVTEPAVNDYITTYNNCTNVNVTNGGSVTCTITNDDVPPSTVTDSSLCVFDRNASSPGQFFYNVFYVGEGGTSITITLPYPFVTQGAVPIHIYSSVATTTVNGTRCFVPGTEIGNSSQRVTLTGYTGMGSTQTVTVQLPPLPGGFAYINMHLDYGLKITSGCTRGANDTAVCAGQSIVNGQGYSFSDTNGGNPTVYSENSFKKNPGVGGLVLKNGAGNPVPNVTVEIYQSTKLLGTVYTDQDGWYMWSYKYTGKAVTFTVKLPAHGLSQSGTLKSNGFLNVNFTVP